MLEVQYKALKTKCHCDSGLYGVFEIASCVIKFRLQAGWLPGEVFIASLSAMRIIEIT